MSNTAPRKKAPAKAAADTSATEAEGAVSTASPDEAAAPEASAAPADVNPDADDAADAADADAGDTGDDKPTSDTATGLDRAPDGALDGAPVTTPSPTPGVTPQPEPEVPGAPGKVRVQLSQHWADDNGVNHLPGSYHYLYPDEAESLNRAGQLMRDDTGAYLTDTEAEPPGGYYRRHSEPENAPEQ
jgi:hypothetical protein